MLLILTIMEKLPMKREKKSPDKVVLVNKSGRKTGIAEKMEAHEKGLLHRAFSIFIFNHKGELLLQKRADSKYHFGGLWTNACCSHPKPGEKTRNAGERRLLEELGFTTSLEMMDHIYYSFHDKKCNLIEYEYDYIMKGQYDGPVIFNPDEVAAIKWISPEKLLQEIKKYPGKFTPWFLLILQKYPLKAICS